ncbi:MAG TPA: polysaccharide biosynthesis/export family protein [Xanthobacteraceae bacterium]|nr:polysaccharide biosynthesis/export family protein [Xanthobacteraceae bacterium]
MRVRLLVVAVLVLLSGCAGFTPEDAPNSVSVYSNAAVTAPASEPVPYALVPINAEVLRAANTLTDDPGGAFANIRGGRYREAPIAVGDIVAVTIFEAQSGGLFIPREAAARSGNFVDLPHQQVDESGNITVPYAGAIKVAGLSARAVSDVIRERIKDRAIDPQAVVSVVDQRGGQVSVLGEVNAALRFGVDPGGIHLLGAIARAGGPKYPTYETQVMLKRAGHIYRETMSAIIHRPSDDVLLAPGDVVYLAREPRFFLVLGSTPSPGAIGGTNDRRFTFEDEEMTLAEALAKAGGLDGTRADSKSLFVLRFEPKSLLERSAISVDGFSSETVPTAYQFDMSKMDGVFFANGFKIRNRDVIVVAESPSTEIIKFMATLNSVTANTSNIATTVSSINSTLP